MKNIKIVDPIKTKIGYKYNTGYKWAMYDADFKLRDFSEV